MRVFIMSLVLFSSIARADKDFYVKDGERFVKVDKTGAVLAILQKKQEVVQCSDMRLTKKLTLKAVSKNDD